MGRAERKESGREERVWGEYWSQRTGWGRGRERERKAAKGRICPILRLVFVAGEGIFREQPSLATSGFIRIVHFAPSRGFLWYFWPFFAFSRALFLLGVRLRLYLTSLCGSRLGSSAPRTQALTDTIYLSARIRKRPEPAAESGTGVLNHVILHTAASGGGGKNGAGGGGME